MQKNTAAESKQERLAKAKKSVYRQAILAGLVILLTMVLVFASITAWYTNVAHTSGLVFEVASWGFTGEVEAYNDEVIPAAPGDSGNIYFSAQNNSENMVDVSVNVTKSMDKEMHKRLFFYVDTSATRAGETMSRTYINSVESYTYTVFSMGNLTLTKQFHNDAQLKWEWVYDLLGYYVKGTMTGGQMQVEEYLRPIEYEYDEANTVFAYPNGDPTKAKELVSIDGTVSVSDFLIELSETDGYPGTIDPTAKQNGWYPVVVDEETGTGVWAYLCNYTEIEMATLWDTQQGKLAAQAVEEGSDTEPPTYTARLNITAEKSELNATVVSTATALEAAVGSLNDSGTDTVVVQLAQDLSVPVLSIPQNKTLVLDLNDNTLTAAGTHLMDAAAGSSVTVLDGELKMPEGESEVAAINSVGAEVTLSNITADGVSYLVRVQDNYGTADSKIRLVGCNITAKQSAVYLAGNGEVSEQLTQLVVEDCDIYGDYMGIVGSGNASSCGTDTTIINSTVKGKWAGVYHPQKDSTMTITSSTIIGNTGLALKGGHTTVIDSEVTGTGAYGITGPAYSNSGFYDTGDGIYMEANYGWEISAEIYGTSKVSGGTMIAEDNTALAVRIYATDATNASATIYGGTFDSDVTAFAAEGTTCTASGTEWIVTIVQE